MGKYLTLIAGLIFIGGCSQEVVDYRQIEKHNGLAYKYQSDEPFTGLVKNQPMNFLGLYQTGSCDVEYKNGLEDGQIKCSNMSGVKIFEAEAKAGKLNGEIVSYDQNTGDLNAKINLKEGVKDGVEITYCPNGQMSAKRHYANGKLAGTEQTWLCNGQQLTDLVWENGQQTGVSITQSGEKINYKNGKRDGEYLSYWPNTQLMRKYNYKNGVQDGIQEEYDQDGFKTKTEVFEDGFPVTKQEKRWDEKGHLLSVVSMVNQREEGETNPYMNNWVRDGLDEKYTSSGVLERHVVWDEGLVKEAVQYTVPYGAKKSVASVRGVSCTEGVKSAVICKDGDEYNWHPGLKRMISKIEWRRGVAGKVWRIDESGNEVFVSDYSHSSVSPPSSRATFW